MEGTFVSSNGHPRVQVAAVPAPAPMTAQSAIAPSFLPTIAAPSLVPSALASVSASAPTNFRPGRTLGMSMAAGAAALPPVETVSGVAGLRLCESPRARAAWLKSRAALVPAGLKGPASPAALGALTPMRPPAAGSYAGAARLGDVITAVPPGLVTGAALYSAGRTLGISVNPLDVNGSGATTLTVGTVTGAANLPGSSVSSQGLFSSVTPNGVLQFRSLTPGTDISFSTGADGDLVITATGGGAFTTAVDTSTFEPLVAYATSTTAGSNLFVGPNGPTYTTENPGTQMFFIANAADGGGTGSFRAGEVTGSEWIRGVRGAQSFACGFNTVASGAQSFAWGNNSYAEGAQAFAGGIDCEAKGGNSFACGQSASAAPGSSNAFVWGGTGSAVTDNGANTFTIAASAGAYVQAGPLYLAGATSGSISMVASATTSPSYQITWPAAQGAAASFTVLTNNGSGALTWASPSVGGAWIVGGNTVTASATLGTNASSDWPLVLETHGITALTISTTQTLAGVLCTATGTTAVALGTSNTASGNYSVALGDSCTAGGEYSFAWGDSSAAPSIGDFCGGVGNSIAASLGYNVIVGGGGGTGVNTINCSGGSNNVIVGGGDAFGVGNSITGSTTVAAAIVGGYNNVASNSWAFIGGGEGNTATGIYSTVAGGLNNHATGGYSFAAGSGSTASGVAAFAVGSATAGGNSSFAWGSGTSAPSVGDFCGGVSNSIAGPSFGYNVLVGGGGGVGNSISCSPDGYCNVIVGGGSHLQNSLTGAGTQDSAIVAGDNNLIGNGSNVLRSFIGAGLGNVISGSYCAIPGGASNSCNGGSYAMAFGNTCAAGALYSLAGGFTTSIAATATGGFALGQYASVLATHTGCFIWGDGSSTTSIMTDNAQEFVVQAIGNGGVTLSAAFYTSASKATGVTLGSGMSAWAPVACERRFKENIVELDSLDVLRRVEDMPIYEYNYIGGDPGIRCRSMMADDWHARFPSGKSKSTIDTQDLDGIAYAAICGLAKLGRESAATIARLELKQLEQEATIRRLEEKVLESIFV